MSAVIMIVFPVYTANSAGLWVVKELAGWLGGWMEGKPSRSAPALFPPVT